MNHRSAGILEELRALGTAQNVKVYRRHGAGDNVFGVSFADLGKLQKKLGVDHELALALWDSGNVDARSLATMVLDPQELKASTVNAWVRSIDYALLSDLLAGAVARSPLALTKMAPWMKSPKEYVRCCGYSLLAACLRDGCDLSDGDCRKILATIEEEIHASPNRARHAMNGALLAIGIYRPKLTKAAIAAAKRIGKVEVDHGETSCKTPEAAAYIEKALARQSRGRARRSLS